jgi:hypothetical protein
MPQEAEERREIIARIVGSETVMTQHRASKASHIPLPAGG